MQEEVQPRFIALPKGLSAVIAHPVGAMVILGKINSLPGHPEEGQQDLDTGRLQSAPSRVPQCSLWDHAATGAGRIVESSTGQAFFTRAKASAWSRGVAPSSVPANLVNQAR